MDASTDPRNQDILVSINGELLPRDKAKVSVFDSVVQGGDAVWEGLRVYDGKIFMLDRHISRLVESAKSMAFADIPEPSKITMAVFETLEANNMYDQAHVRLTLTRGLKTTSGMSPEFNRSGCTLIVLAEWKNPVYSDSGIQLVTSAIRRNPPQCIDSKIHHNNLINNILAKIEANLAQVDDAVMLDIEGFVSETNATNIFLFKNQELRTPWADFCLPGITREVVISIAQGNQIPWREKRLSLTELYTADEVFVTGTMGEITPVLQIDGREIGQGIMGPLTANIKRLYQDKTRSQGSSIPQNNPS